MLDNGRDPEGPCQFMGQTGCTLQRWTRAFKCTWFFCEPLLAALNEGEPRKARRLSVGRLGKTLHLAQQNSKDVGL
jgi:hypothetical protein